MAPLISICIPAYNRADYLEKLLDSIKIQDYKNFNVIITDDSTDDTVMHLVKKYETSFEIKYYKNSPAFGMPQNWNYCIETANGAWIKIMHDDDCFATAGSLAGFAAATATDTSVIFSAYHIRDEKIKTVKSMRLKPQEADRIRQNPFMLFYSNIAGPPSVTMVRKDLNEYYDTRLRWVVDFEYYFRIISKGGFTYIPEALIDITQNDSQITNSCFRNKEVEIPDTLLLYEKYGKKLTGNITQYNSWWRFVRNLDIRSADDCRQYARGRQIPQFVIDIINFQQRFPHKLLLNGYVSRSLMAFHYLTRFKTREQ